MAPFRTFQSKTRSEPWIDDSIRSLRRCCRRAERKLKKDRLHVSFEILKDTLFKYQKAVKKAKCRHLSDIINKNCSSPKTLFNIINATLNPSACLVPGVSSPSCEEFLLFFDRKIRDLRLGITPSFFNPSNPFISTTFFSQFKLVSPSDLLEIVEQLKPSGSSLDIIPPFLFKQIDVAPYLLIIINRSLESGIMPDCLKHAVVYPLLKKLNLDSSVLTNFRPISNLPFISKILEKIVFSYKVF